MSNAPMPFQVGCPKGHADASHTFTTLPKDDALEMALTGKCPTCDGPLWVAKISEGK